MVEITYKRRTEDRYEHDGKVLRDVDTDKIVTFENLDYGGYASDVLLELVDGNEWRVVTEALFSRMKLITVEVEPPSKNCSPTRGVYRMVALLNIVGVAVGTLLVVRGIELGDVLRGVAGALCVVVNIGSLVREGL